MKRVLSVLAIAAAAAFARPAAAGTVQANVAVTATISNNCTVAAGSVDFGAYDPLVTNATADLDKAGAIAVSCTAGTVGSIELADGSNFSATNGRQMAGAGLLKYELYQDSGRTQRWGTVAKTQERTLPGFATTSTQTVAIYGRVFSGQTSAQVGSYSDTVVATVNF